MLQYKGLKGTLERLVVSDRQVSDQIDRLMAQNPRIIAVTDRPSQSGDELVLDYAGYCDGVQFEGGTAQKQTLTLGSGAFIPGFEEQLVGKNIGDAVDVRVTFPAQYHAPALAGKAAVFKCAIHGIRQRRPYDDGDAFAREVCGLPDMAALRDRVWRGMQSHVMQRADEDLKARLLDAAMEGFDCPIDADALEGAVQQQMDVLSARLAQQGLDLEAYCRFTGKTEAQLREACLPDARLGLRRQAAIDEIARAEGIEADEASVARAIEALCRQNGMTPAQIAPHIDEAARAALERNVITEKALECLKRYAEVTVVDSRD